MDRVNKRALLVFVFFFVFAPLFPVIADELPAVASHEEDPIQAESALQASFKIQSTEASSTAATIPASLSNHITPSTIKQLLPDTNANTGALVYLYPIIIPPGRNGMQPDITLRYNNQQNEEASLFGYGWSVSIPSIERLNKKGSEGLFNYGDFTSSLSGELSALTDTTYGAKSDHGEFLEYSTSDVKNGTVWVMRDKRGTVYTFGGTSAERQDNPKDTTQVFKWMISEIRDRHDNFVSFSYEKNEGQIYPKLITYTGHGTTSGIFTVEFIREARGDVGKSYKEGFLVQTKERVSKIKMSVNNSWVRTYDLDYSPGQAGLRSLLTSITETGQSDEDNILTRPPTKFSYESQSADSYKNINATFGDTSWVSPVYSDTGVIVVDVNGDALPDILSSVMTYSVGTSCGLLLRDAYLNTGSGWVADSTWLPPLEMPFGSKCNGSQDTGIQAVDLNGDGLTDLVRNQSFNDVYLNTGSGWKQDTSYSNFSGAFTQPQGQIHLGSWLVDLNADGLPDWIKGYNGSTTIQLNTGTGWGTQVTNGLFSFPVPESLFANSGVAFADVNHDELTDILRGGGWTVPYTWINTGFGWVKDEMFKSPTGFLESTDGGDGGVRAIDLNHDGLTDLAQKAKYNAQAWLNTGSGWMEATAWEPQGSCTFNFMLKIVDLNADGLTDWFCAVGPNYPPTTYSTFNTGTHNDELVHILYPTGGSTDITYKSSHVESSKLPIVIQVVDSIINNDGLATTSSFTYTYEGGFYFSAELFDRKFGGFHSIVRRDASGNTLTTWYHQGNTTDASLGEYDDHFSKIGKPFRVEVADSAGKILTTTINKWNKNELPNLGKGSWFIKLVSSLRLDFDGNSTHRDRAVNYTYDDANGNLISMDEWGEVNGGSDGTFTDIGSDKRTTAISYTTNAWDHLDGFPILELVTDQAGAKVSETRSYYDLLPFGSVNKGNLTRQESWKYGDQYTHIERTYDTYGFLLKKLDPRDKPTTYTPDSYNLYPATVTNAMNQSTQYTYDYSSGKSIQVTDPNGTITKTTYDAFDRPLEENQSSPNSASTLETKTTYAYVSETIGERTTRSDFLSEDIAKDVYSYTDGFDRPIQTRVEAETENQFSVTDTLYDSRGYIQKQSLPYFSSGSARTNPTTTHELFSTFSYDALGRTTNIATIVGATSSVYDQWTTMVTDPRGKIKTYIKDAFDRLTSVVEHNVSSSYTTSYQYNFRGDLTKLTDALGNVRSFTYDASSRRLSAQDLHAPTDTTFGTWMYTYDDAGNLLSSVDPKNQTVQYAYDDLNRPLTEDFLSSSGIDVISSYDVCANGIGRLCSVSKTGFSQLSSYDALGRVSSQTRTIDETSYVTTTLYDRAGNVILLTNPDGSQVQSVYNSAGFLNALERKENGGVFTPVITNIDYAPTGKRTTIAYANGTTTTNTYDEGELYRLRTKVTSFPSGNVQHLSYSYDPNGNIVQIVDASTTLSAKTIGYSYDDLNRLLSATITGSANNQNDTQSYTYDAIGNILTRSDVGSYVYAGNTGASYANPHAATAIAGVTNTYDNNGNLTTSSSLTTSTITPTATPPWYSAVPGTWSKRLPLTIQESQITGTTALTNFPLLVSLKNVNLRATTNGGFVTSATGDDLLFTASDGITKLNHEIESYNPTTGALIAWVKVPSISATVNTSVYLYFANAEAPNQQNVTGTWEPDYKGVWHLKENPSTTGALILDSTSNAYHGTPYGSMPSTASTTARVGKGIVFDGLNDYLDVGKAANIGSLTNNFTLSVWVQPTSLVGVRRFIAPQRFISNNGFGFGTGGYAPRVSTFGVKEYGLASKLSLFMWQRVDVVMQNNNVTFYKNGVALGTVKHTKGGLANPDDILLIGGTSPVGGKSLSEKFKGKMDELRVYHGSRDAQWILAEYNNQSLPTMFVKTGVIQSIPVPTMAAPEVTTYSWDYANRLSSISSSTLSASFAYDYDGIRVKSAFGTTTTRYPTSSYSITGSTPTKHLSFPDDELVATIEGSGVAAVPRYIHTDHLTGSSVITSTSGSQLQLLDYHPFGTLRLNNQSSTFNEKRKFAGQEYDTESGLSYMVARYYSPGIGKFISQDPVSLTLPSDKLQILLTDPQRWNGYVYGGNNPLRYRDPDGKLFGIDDAAIITAALVLAPAAMNLLQTIATTPVLQAGIANDLQSVSSPHASGLARGMAGASLLTNAIPFGVSPVWSLNSFKRGREIEAVFGNNLGWNFPVIDKLENSIVTSIKSIDPGAKTYQKLSALENKLKGYVNQLVEFTGKTWAGLPVTPDTFSTKELQVIIPQGSLTNEINTSIKKVADYAKSVGVQFKLSEH